MREPDNPRISPEAVKEQLCPGRLRRRRHHPNQRQNHDDKANAEAPHPAHTPTRTHMITVGENPTNRNPDVVTCQTTRRATLCKQHPGAVAQQAEALDLGSSQ